MKELIGELEIQNSGEPSVLNRKLSNVDLSQSSGGQVAPQATCAASTFIIYTSLNSRERNPDRQDTE